MAIVKIEADEGQLLEQQEWPDTGGELQCLRPLGPGIDPDFTAKTLLDEHFASTDSIVQVYTRSIGTGKTMSSRHSLLPCY